MKPAKAPERRRRGGRQCKVWEGEGHKGGRCGSTINRLNCLSRSAGDIRRAHPPPHSSKQSKEKRTKGNEAGDREPVGAEALRGGAVAEVVDHLQMHARRARASTVVSITSSWLASLSSKGNKWVAFHSPTTEHTRAPQLPPFPRHGRKCGGRVRCWPGWQPSQPSGRRRSGRSCTPCPAATSCRPRPKSSCTRWPAHTKRGRGYGSWDNTWYYSLTRKRRKHAPKTNKFQLSHTRQATHKPSDTHANAQGGPGEAPRCPSPGRATRAGRR